MYRVDLHVKILNRAVVERAKARDLDAIVYAPHFTPLPEIQSRAAAFSDDDLTVIPARELFTGSWRARKHVLAIGLRDPVPDFLSLDTTIEACLAQRAAIVVPHPTFLTISLGAEDIHRHRSAIDAIEVYNPKFLPLHTRRARRLADSMDCTAVGSSYAHLTRSVGAVWTNFSEPVGSAAAVRDQLTSGTVEGVENTGGLGHLMTRCAEGSHIVWENSWPKLRRVLGPGVEPTHPTQPLYADQFSDSEE